MLQAMNSAPGKVGECIENFEIRSALKLFMDLCRSANKYFNDQAPWKTRKNDISTCYTTMNICLHICRVITSLMAPFMPKASEKLKDILQIKEDLTWESNTNNEEFPTGHEIGKPEILFQKIEDELIQTEIDKLNLIVSPGANEG